MFVFVDAFAFALRIQGHGGETEGPMIVQLGIEMRHVELLDPLGVVAGEVSPTDVLADDRAVLAFHQGIVLALEGA